MKIKLLNKNSFEYENFASPFDVVVVVNGRCVVGGVNLSKVD